ncbi:MAG: glutamine amidotransferase [Deltaproteobacteria bacterium]|jgi:GMP synthase (glutamine-hydrolysing)|nr:glutamine amidotransferase [Deltaproteobacteria bacterium]
MANSSVDQINEGENNPPILIIECGGLTLSKTNQRINFGPMFMEAAPFSPREAIVINAEESPLTVKPQDFKGIIITGSLSMASELEPWSRCLIKWLSKAVDKDVPILGVCFGHHLMARVFGGKVDYHPMGQELGSHDIFLSPLAKEHPLLESLPSRFPAYLAHSQTVTDLPSQAMVLASSEHDDHQILAYGENILTCQFHPEFTKSFMMAFIEEIKDYEAPQDLPSVVNLGQVHMKINHAKKLLRLFGDMVLEDNYQENYQEEIRYEPITDFVLGRKNTI